MALNPSNSSNLEQLTLKGLIVQKLVTSNTVHNMNGAFTFISIEITNLILKV